MPAVVFKSPAACGGTLFAKEGKGQTILNSLLM
jgi:hypothetical protein